MAKIIHKEKNPFGGYTYLDENFHVIGYGRVNSSGHEILVDKDFRYAGEKRKDILGGDVYLDRNWKVQGYGQKGLLGETFIADKDFRYQGWAGKSGPGEILFMDGDRREENQDDIYQRGKLGILSGIVFFAVCVVIIVVMWMLWK